MTDALQTALKHDVPNLSAAQCELGASLYTEALFRAVGSLEEFALPIIVQTLFDMRSDLKEGQTETRNKLDQIIQGLQNEQNAFVPNEPSIQIFQIEPWLIPIEVEQLSFPVQSRDSVKPIRCAQFRSQDYICGNQWFWKNFCNESSC